MSKYHDSFKDSFSPSHFIFYIAFSVIEKKHYNWSNNVSVVSVGYLFADRNRKNESPRHFIHVTFLVLVMNWIFLIEEHGHCVKFNI